MSLHSQLNEVYVGFRWRVRATEGLKYICNEKIVHPARRCPAAYFCQARTTYNVPGFLLVPINMLIDLVPLIHSKIG